MKEITFDYLRDWKVTDKFTEIYHKQVCMIGKLDKSVLTQDQIEEYNYFDLEEYDGIYIGLVHIEHKDSYGRVFIGSSLKKLLEKHGYKNYEGNIKVYGEFGERPTTKSNIGKVWKAEILDDKLNVIAVLE